MSPNMILPELIPTLDHWYPDEDRVTWENERPYAIFWPNAEQGPSALLNSGQDLSR